MLKVGMGVGRPASGGTGWTGTGADEGMSRGAAAGPQAATESRNAARKRVLTAQAYRRGGRVVRILRLPTEKRYDSEVRDATAWCEECEAQAPIRAHQAQRERSRAVEQGRGAYRRRDDQQDAPCQRRDERVTILGAFDLGGRLRHAGPSRAAHELLERDAPGGDPLMGRVRSFVVAIGPSATVDGQSAFANGLGVLMRLGDAFISDDVRHAEAPPRASR